jgi:hypothetical protein
MNSQLIHLQFNTHEFSCYGGYSGLDIQRTEETEF